MGVQRTLWLFKSGRASLACVARTAHAPGQRSARAECRTRPRSRVARGCRIVHAGVAGRARIDGGTDGIILDPPPMPRTSVASAFFLGMSPSRPPLLPERCAPADEDEDTDTVLIVEDEPDVTAVAAELFRSIGYEVLTAGTGHDAIDILKCRRDIDVLFTDVMMPNGMSGIELTRFTGKLCPSVKVILASGYPLPALKAEHGNLDEFAFVSKPYRLSELAKKLRASA
jgi:CheY-like chemotaxis protein